jgi:hypothetical protein
VTNQSLDRAKIGPFLRRAECDRDTLSPGSTGPADPMNVTFRFHRHVIVDHMGDPINVDPSCSDVRRHKNLNLVRPQRLECALPRILRFIAVNGCRLKTVLRQLSCHSVGTAFRSCKHQCLPNRSGRQRLLQCRSFRAAIEEHHALVNFPDTGLFRSHIDSEWIGQQPLREFDNSRRHRGGKEQRLSIIGQSTDDAFQVGQKAHIHHSVRFIKHKDLQFIQLDIPLIHQIQQASGSGNHDMGALFCSLNLLMRADTTKHLANTNGQMSAISLETVGNLNRQFASWSQYQHIRMTGHGATVFTSQIIQNG